MFGLMRRGILLVAVCAGCSTILGLGDLPPLQTTLDGDGGEDAVSSPFTVVQGVPTGETLEAIWGANASTLFAAGTNGVHYDYYGGSWHRLQSTLGRDYFGIWGTSAKDVYAVGALRGSGKGVIEHFDGQAWRDEYLADTPLHGIWGVGTLVFAVGAKGMVYGKFLGTKDWGPRLSAGLPANPKVPSSADSPILWAISGNNENDFTIAADRDRIFHYTGNGDFVNLDPVADRSQTFVSAWGFPGTKTNVYLGSNYFGINWLGPSNSAPTDVDASVRDGEVWRLFEDRSLSGSEKFFLRGIWGDEKQVVFVGDKGHIYSLSLGQNKIRQVPAPTDGVLGGVWWATTSDVWIVGERELILHGSLSP